MRSRRQPSVNSRSTLAGSTRLLTTPPGTRNLHAFTSFPAQRWSQAPRPGAARLGGARRTVEGCDTGSEPRWSFAENAGAELSSSKPSFLTAASTLPPLDSAMSTHAHEYPCIEHSPGQDPLCPPLFQGSRSLGARERRIRPAIEKDSSATHTAGVRPCPSPSPPRPAAPMRAHAVRSGEPRLRVAARLHPLLIPLVTALCAQELSVCTRDGSGRLGSPRRYYALRLSPLPLVLAGTGGCAHAAHCHCGSQHGHDAAGAEVLGVAAASRP